MKSYEECSYREKFCRTLWVIPFIAMFKIFNMEFLGISANIWVILLTIGFFIQAIYNYVQWKNEER